MTELAMDLKEKGGLLYVTGTPDPVLRTALTNNGWEVVVARDVEAVRSISSRLGSSVGLLELTNEQRDLTAFDVLDRSPSHLHWIALVSRERLEMEEFTACISKTCYDFHTPPIDLNRLLVTLGRAKGMAKLRQTCIKSQAEQSAEYGIVGNSAAIKAVRRSLERLAPAEAPVLITGESGTGKELVASAIHFNSRRKNQSYIQINCGAIPGSLFQSELFGHEKGSFTGAHMAKIGKLEAAQNGTIFLDEISELSADLQVNFLRILQERRLQRVGSTSEIDLNVRVVAATNVDLDDAVREGRFREDLYYRLNVLRIRMPPLRERLEDIDLLAYYFFDVFSNEKREFIKGFSRGALAAMRRYRWPGNVRELINRVRRALITSENQMISVEDLGLGNFSDECRLLTLGEARAKVEKGSVEKALTLTRNNCSEAARMLGVTRATLYRLMCKYEINREREDALQVVGSYGNY